MHIYDSCALVSEPVLGVGGMGWGAVKLIERWGDALRSAPAFIGWPHTGVSWCGLWRLVQCGCWT